MPNLHNRENTKKSRNYLTTLLCSALLCSALLSSYSHFAYPVNPLFLFYYNKTALKNKPVFSQHPLLPAWKIPGRKQLSVYTYPYSLIVLCKINHSTSSGITGRNAYAHKVSTAKKLHATKAIKNPRPPKPLIMRNGKNMTLNR